MNAKRNGRRRSWREQLLMASAAGAAFGGILIAVAHEGASLAETAPVSVSAPAADAGATQPAAVPTVTADAPAADPTVAETPAPIPRSRRSRAS